ncbi:MAG: hypothetical protein II787_04195 [Lachnospiraceae bacterium]|nr:hypothetical protein [Lachnospiraceae bacterium]
MKKIRSAAAVLMALIVITAGGAAGGEAFAAERGAYPSRPGTILVTPNNINKVARLFKLGHAAIVLNRSTVVEAALPTVKTSKNAWKRRARVKRLYGVSVNHTSRQQDRKAARWCRRQVGRPYNINYMDVFTRERFYCSHLVWAAFLDNFGIDMNTAAYGRMIAPMELVNSPETSVIYSYKR